MRLVSCCRQMYAETYFLEQLRELQPSHISCTVRAPVPFTIAGFARAYQKLSTTASDCSVNYLR